MRESHEITSLFVYDSSIARRSALKFYFLLASFTVIFSGAMHFSNQQDQLADIEAKQASLVDNIEIYIRNQFYESVADLLVLARQTALYNNTVNSNEQLARALVSIAQVKKQYQQLRFINNEGDEAVRVNNYLEAELAPTSDLQNKSQRYYYVEAMGLEPGQVYVSQMDLNMEQGEIVVPHQPQLRIASPVRGEHGERTGLLVFNLDVSEVLKFLGRIDYDRVGDFSLLNRDGYWLYHHDVARRWGFQLPHGQSFAQQYPQSWLNIHSANQGQLFTQGDLTTFAMIDGLVASDKEARLRYAWGANRPEIMYKSSWYIVSTIDATTLSGLLYENRRNSIWRTVMFLMLLIPVAYFWGQRSARLRQHQEKLDTFAKFVEKSSEVIYITDPKGHILFTNSAFERSTGYRQDEVLGKTPALFKSGKHPEEFYQLLWNSLKRGESFSNVFVNKRKDGSIYFEEKDITPIKNARGDVKYFVSNGRDLSQLYAMQEHKMQITSQLSQSVAHHFNNLFSALLGYLDLSLNRLKNRELAGAEKSLEKSVNTLLRAQELIGKIEKTNHRKINEYALSDIRQTMVSVVEQFSANIRNDVGVYYDIDEALPLLRVDHELLRTAVVALLENARQAFAEHGNILVTVKVITPVSAFCINCGEPLNGQYVAIIVEDNGFGMGEEIQGRVFDPFFTTRENALTNGKTPGLGLTMVRGIAHLHGGHMLLHSQSGSGTCVTLLLPVEPASANEDTHTLVENQQNQVHKHD